MIASRLSGQSILWHSLHEPVLDLGKLYSGHARTPFGTLCLTWTDQFLLHLGFDELKPAQGLCDTAQNLADLIVSRAPLPLRPVAIGTPFQLQVWMALTGIPFGCTTSYGGIAATIGCPKAFRAVGSAIGANRLALLIPCHRVIRSDGHLGGFRWGLDTKKRILAHEKIDS